MLTVSSAGFEAIGIERAPHESATAAAERNSTRKPARQKPTNGKKATASSKRSGSKQDIIIGLLQRPKGATVPDLQAATGWQPHSVRAALTGWRKKGHEIVRTHGNGGATQYRIIDNQNAD